MTSLILLSSNPLSKMIFDFNVDSNLDSWYVLDDVVMGGRSSGTLVLDEDGMGVFEGKVSLENNGGFSSIRHAFEAIDLKGLSKIKLRVKGDGKRYQFRLKDKTANYYSYIQYFNTSTEWEEIVIDLNSMYPSFRGRELDMDNFNETRLEEISILIANKKNEGFKLIIDKIELI